jgi:release factor glutamine methyltransferase
MHQILSRLKDLCIVTDTLEYKKNDRVLPIIKDEQELMCDSIWLSGGESVLDVGTGSGVLAVYAASKGCHVTGIDVCERSIIYAKFNTYINGYNIEFIKGAYKKGVISKKKYDIIIFNPPHNPTPPDLKLPIHANGGSDGITVCKKFVDISIGSYIASNGRIVFLQLSPSNNNLPEIIKNISYLNHQGFSIKYCKILPTIAYKIFLDKVYKDKYPEWVNKSLKKYGELDYIYAEIWKDDRGITSEYSSDYVVSQTWDERIKLHEMIVSDYL